MIRRFVVPATAAAFWLFTAPVFAAQTTAPAQSAAMQRCAQLESQIDANLPMAEATELPAATAERGEGAKLCAAGKTDQGLAKLQQALIDTMHHDKNG
jgi:hypothetical protein